MSENTSIPSLTLTPEADEAAAAAAQAAPEAPALTLAPEAKSPAEAVQDAAPAKIDESMLSEAERKIVDDFSKKIDLTDSTQVLQYGTAAQKNIASFSESALNKVRTKDLGEVGDTLSSLVVELNNNAPGTETRPRSMWIRSAGFWSSIRWP